MLWRGDTLGLLHWNHIWVMMIIWSDPSMFHGAVSPWSLQCKDKGHISYPQENHNPHPQGGEGEGGQNGHITLERGWGGSCQTWIIYIYMCVCVHAIVYLCAILDHVHTVFRCCHTIRIIVDTLFFVFGSTCCMIFMYLYHLYIYIHISTSNLHVIPLFVV